MSARFEVALIAALAGAFAAPSARAAGEHPFETDAQRVPALHTGGSCVIRNAVIHSAVGPAFEGDVLVRNGDIAKVGDVGAVEGVVEIDGRGMHLSPGVVDCHSHTAIARGVNEGTLSITADCDISDALDAEDLAIYRALAGGVTTARLLHGSANTIGGRHEVIKLKWRRSEDELGFRGAPEGIKFALGENVKRSNGPGGNSARFPATRMGVEALLYRAFSRAREYGAQWAEFEAARARGEDPPPPRRDVRLDVLSGILAGKIDVHAHCYRADEIVMLLRVAEKYGFKIKTLQHVLEGYKVAAEIAAHGAGPSTFSDWWAYKVEAYDAVPFNAALLDEAGAVTSLNSDSDELMRRLFADAAKGVRYGNMDPVRALALVTINPARQLGIDRFTGSIEAGKDADLVLHTGDPLSAYSRVVWTMVDGEIEFTRHDAFELDTKPAAVTEITEPADATGVAWREDGGPTVAITGGTLHPVTSPEIERGTLLIQGGRIVAMGANVAIPAGARVIDASGKHVWPGMIALDTNLGLFEIGSVQATVDQSEIGGNQPDLRTSAAISGESAHIGVTRYNGVTRAQSAPQGGGPFMGQSCVIRLEGETWEDLVALDRDMLHVDFPRVANTAKEKKEPETAVEMRKSLAEAREHARLIELAASHGTARPPFDARLEALAPYALGKKRVAVHVDNAQSILYALKFIADEKLDAVLYGVGEGWKVAEAIAKQGVPCVVGPVLALPRDRYDPYDAAYANAAVLHRAGVRIAIAPIGDENVRNVAFHAAMASAFGLPREEALRAVTFYPARVLGLERDLGSLAPGKVADVVVTDGDLLEIATHVEYVFVDGEQTSLANRQTELYQRYRERLRRLQRR
jgi:imidazolonepropionase-like amidohydrolase